MYRVGAIEIVNAKNVLVVVKLMFLASVSNSNISFSCVFMRYCSRGSHVVRFSLSDFGSFVEHSYPLVNEWLEGGKNVIFGRLSIDQVRAVLEREPKMTASKTPSSRTDKVQLSICVCWLHSIAYDCQVRVVPTTIIN